MGEGGCESPTSSDRILRYFPNVMWRWLKEHTTFRSAHRGSPGSLEAPISSIL